MNTNNEKWIQELKSFISEEMDKRFRKIEYDQAEIERIRKEAVREERERIRVWAQNPSFIGVLESNEKRRGYVSALDELLFFLDTDLK